MYVVLAYDVNQKRVGKVLKICRKYLTHIQKSVFEGGITEAKLATLKRELMQVIDCEVDSICIYEWQSMKYTRKEEIGTVEDHGNIF